ncbi:carbonic anhydrase [Roseibium marinum]|uniref:carbonic anhydrase n=1 Tax=Roseibium marinum TaxID=281252 RepID=A0A2S3UJ56_9HYPH|nr:carbonic anhydrase [Roseibium marinum]
MLSQQMLTTGRKPGEIIVHRDLANLVHPSDLNLLSVLEFAVENLWVKHINVCSNSGYGGVKTAKDSTGIWHRGSLAPPHP